MKKTYLLVGLISSILGFSQTAIGGINSGSISSENLMYSVGEIYVIPTNQDETNSGLLGIYYQNFKTLGINELVVENVSVYPNPTTDFIYFKVNSKAKLSEVEVFDLSGKLIFTQRVNNETIDLQKLSKGTYFLRFKNSTIKPIKIIKN